MDTFIFDIVFSSAPDDDLSLLTNEENPNSPGNGNGYCVIA